MTFPYTDIFSAIAQGLRSEGLDRSVAMFAPRVGLCEIDPEGKGFELSYVKGINRFSSGDAAGTVLLEFVNEFVALIPPDDTMTAVVVVREAWMKAFGRADSPVSNESVQNSFRKGLANDKASVEVLLISIHRPGCVRAGALQIVEGRSFGGQQMLNSPAITKTGEFIAGQRDAGH